jgi:predicted transposase/invertase (TIGR01784 family)
VKTDTLFYRLFQTFPRIFFELIERPPEEANVYEFTSRELKQFAFRLDGLFLPKTDEPDKPFYLVEVQFQSDEELYSRLFAELFLYIRQYKPPHPWQVVVIYPSRNLEKEQTHQFGELLTLSRVRRIYLNELKPTADTSLGVGAVKLVIEPEQTAEQLARRLIEQARQQLTDEAVLRDLINLIETIIVYKLPQKSREEIEAMLGLSELKQTRFYQEVKQEGLEEGLVEGEQKAKLEAIPRMLRFNLGLDAIAQLLDLPLPLVQQVAQWFHAKNLAALIQLLTEQRALFSPENLAELEQWLAPVPDELEALSKALSAWSQKPEQAAIFKAQIELLSTFPRDVLAQIQASEVEEGGVKSPEPQPNKQTVLEAIAPSR